MKNKKMGLASCSWILVVIGAINWGIMGLSALMGKQDVNVLEMLVSSTTLTAVIYLLIGLAGVKILFSGNKCNRCN